jgi:arginyl-tRNA synthetase
MQVQQILRHRLADALRKVSESAVDLSDMVRPTQDPAHGDFQINSAMPLAKRLGSKPRDVAAKIVDALEVEDICQSPEIAGPGFINLTLTDAWITASAMAMLRDDRLGVETTADPKTIVIDFSSPNVAKPMHVGHIRSTVIGDALSKVLRFLGHHVITDNHLGDWGTQFGMIIYGHRHFLDAAEFERQPVAELLRIYRIVNGLIDHHTAVQRLLAIAASVDAAAAEIEKLEHQVAGAAAKDKKRVEKALAAANKRLRSAKSTHAALEQKIAGNLRDATFRQRLEDHPKIATDVLTETAKLHAGDAENLALWKQLLPYCLDEIERVYDRLDVQFDHVLGESFYNDKLPGVVQDLRDRGLATTSEGAVCVFLEGFDAPMIIQKQDGAYLYATSDIATLQHRQKVFQADEILYVVDFRQADHFKKLFQVAQMIGMEQTKLVHVSFGTVLDESGRPLKTRSGNLAGLVALLDDAVQRASQVVCDPERTERIDPPLSDDEQRQIAETVGIGAIKYADLAHHRTSDYKFSLEKMVALDGSTAAYIQYAFARIQGIMRSAEIDEKTVREQTSEIICSHIAERSLLISFLKFEEVLVQVREEHAPNLLVDYLYEIAKGLAVMYEHCMVLKAETPALKQSRLAIVVLAGRMLRQGLQLLGIGVVHRM